MIYGDAQLPPQYTVFGSIDAGGLQVLDKIAKAGDGRLAQRGRRSHTPVRRQHA